MLRLKFDPATAPRELARDEAMLVWADSIVENEDVDQPTEMFRTWTFEGPTVVLGRSSKINEEVDREFCEAQSIEVLRRCTGGASVVGGPGCLMYSVVIATPGEGGLRKIDVAHDYVMQRVLAAVRIQVPAAERLGICDLTLDGKKFSGNSLRVARHHLLYHGTILLSSDLALVARCLDHAPRQPEYRRGRDHGDFITNIELDEAKLIDALGDSFEATDVAGNDWHTAIEGAADELLASRYGDSAWHTRR